MEVAAVEGGMGDEIDHVGLAGPDTVPCVAVRWQIAQKLHACIETFEQGENDRFRDLLDLQLLADLVEDDEWAAVRAACGGVFEARAKPVSTSMVTSGAAPSPCYRSPSPG